MKRISMLVMLVVTIMMLGTGIAAAHSVNVNPPGEGSGTCQFMGGPGNPGHVGHSHGHTVALAAEQSDAISIGGC